ncbi:TBC1 domain family member 30 isoform X1 [Daphnia magna]|uniref:TBC1 domain family member 30 n=1 Tax=Daphnia magna TaxID=35525 RepID=A0A0P6BGR1_9CRUS|nr:TBC1 domain family member 30 isoform X1 [Daphnia magna]KZS19474.1 putative TBC1 domain family member 30 [Daphnia magna]
MMYSTLKKLPDLSYRSHKLQMATDGDARSFDSFDIRPAYLDRGRFVDPFKWVATPMQTSNSATTISANNSNKNSRAMTSSPAHGESGVSGVTGVTGIPNLVELDDAFNTLDPGQLLRLSAFLSETPRTVETMPSAQPVRLLERRRKSSSMLVDDLLHEIYRQPSRKYSGDDDEAFSSSEDVSNSESTNNGIGEVIQGSRFSSKCAEPLKKKDTSELVVVRDHLREALSRVTTSLIQQLTKRDRLALERERHCDVITAILQAASPKRSQDTKMRFSIDPPANSIGSSTSSLQSPCSSSPQQKPAQHQLSESSGFQQWHDAMRMVARLPGGVPPEFRRKLWLALAEQHLLRIGVDWSDVERNCFNDRINPDDEDLGAQIVRDLHRTGCSLFCGEDALPNQALLKRVLLAYARWNKEVGYCQGLNVLAALLLEVMNRSEVESLKVMIYLIEGVLPTGYFANNLRGLSIDMAVFRDLLRQRLPALSRHFEMLQQSESSTGSSSSYCIEPPLTNVFTMQWFLTLFATCLPKAAVLRVWDLIFLEGNDILLRTALAIWQTLAERILTVRTCDDFYSIMAVLAREMLEFGLMEPNHLVQTIVSMAPFPFPGLNELRDKYRYNITPWSGGSGRVRLFYSDDDPDMEAEEDEDEEKTKAMNAVATVFGGLMTSSSLFRHTGRRITDITFRKSNNLKHTSSSASPIGSSSNEKEKLQLDIAALRKQYAKLRERQKQAHVMFWTVASGASSSARRGSSDGTTVFSSSSASSSTNPVNHLLAGRKPLLARRPSVSSSPSTSSNPSQQGPKLRLPPPRIPPALGTNSNDDKAYFSAPSTPSDKPDGQPAFGNMTADVAYPSKDPNQRQHNKQHQQQRRNSGSATSSTIEQQQRVTPSSCQSATSLPMMATTTRTPPITVNRSRLVQELLEQNSAMLLKLKDRPKVTTSAGLSSLSLDNDNEPDLGDGHDQQRTSLNNSNSANSPVHHHPFPRQGTRTPKDVTIKLGLYSPTQKF